MLFSLSTVVPGVAGDPVQPHVLKVSEVMNPAGPALQRDVAEAADLDFQAEEGYSGQQPGDKVQLEDAHALIKPKNVNAMFFRICVTNPNQVHLIPGAFRTPLGSLGVVEAKVLMTDSESQQVRVALEAPDATSQQACLLDVSHLSKRVLLTLRGWSTAEADIIHHLALPLSAAWRRSCEAAVAFLLKIGGRTEYTMITDGHAACHKDSLIHLETWSVVEGRAQPTEWKFTEQGLRCLVPAQTFEVKQGVSYRYFKPRENIAVQDRHVFEALELLLAQGFEFRVKTRGRRIEQPVCYDVNMPEPVKRIWLAAAFDRAR